MNIKNEIEELTGTKTAVAVEGVTMIQRFLTWLRAWWEWRSLPKGQRFVKSGFKSITMAQLRERLGVNAMNKSPATDHRWKWLEGKGLDMSTVDKIVTTMAFSTMMDSFRVYFKDGTNQHYSPMDVKRETSVIVKLEALSTYVRDEIPARCLQSVKRAKRMGLSQFHVAFPVMEEVPQRDPIILAKWEGKVGEENSVYLEIDMWE